MLLSRLLVIPFFASSLLFGASGNLSTVCCCRAHQLSHLDSPRQNISEATPSRQASLAQSKSEKEGPKAETPDKKPDWTHIVSEAKLPLLNPALAERQEAKIRLKNGLEAFIVSDPGLQESGAVLTVRAGSWHEPSELPGLAHFLEHLLFLGTKSYPDENAYSRYISEHGGTSNAFTTSGYTSYMFSINNSAFEGGLDRFSKFFIEPAFNASGVQRELNAIDQEYAQNLQKDDVRLIYVLKALSKPSHPNFQFTMGNSASLAKVTRDDIIHWYQTHYSANLMRLAVFSPLPLDQLEALVAKEFSAIPEIAVEKSAIEEYALPESLLGHMIYVEPVKDLRNLILAWELPKTLSLKTDEQPASIISHFLGHEGEKSLLGLLKKEHLATGIKSGAFQFGPGDQMLMLQINLTTEGVLKRDTVIERVFQAIDVLKSDASLRYIYDEIEQIQTINYQYQGREDLFSHIVDHGSWLAEHSMERYPENAEIIQRFDEEAIRATINQLTPKQAVYLLQAPANQLPVTPDQTEPWLHTSFAIQPIDPKQLSEWSNLGPIPEIALPEKNPFIPENLQLIPAQKGEGVVPIPSLILESDKGRFFFSNDNRYHLPAAYLKFHLKTPHINAGDSTSVVLADLLVAALEESLNIYLYDATLTGLNYSLEREENGISITVKGYSDKIDNLMAEILKQIKTLNISIEQFAILKEALARGYANAEKESPIKQSLELFRQILYKRYNSPKVKNQSIQTVDYQQFLSFYQTVFDKIYVEGILFGNLSEEEGKTISQNVIQALTGDAYLRKDQLKTEVITLPNNGPYYIEEEVQVRGNASLLAVEYIDFSFKARAAQQILMQAMSDAFFATLRTRQQTAYLVSTRAEEIERKLFNIFAVQSNSHDVRDLLARFELFIEGFLQELRLEEITEARFEKIRSSLLSTLEHPPVSLSEMGALLDRFLTAYDADFHWLDKRIEGMHTLTYEEFLLFARDFLGRQNKRRLAILLKGELPNEKLFRYQLVEGLKEIRALSEYSSHSP